MKGATVLTPQSLPASLRCHAPALGRNVQIRGLRFKHSPCNTSSKVTTAAAAAAKTAPRRAPRPENVPGSFYVDSTCIGDTSDAAHKLHEVATMHYLRAS